MSTKVYQNSFCGRITCAHVRRINIVGKFFARIQKKLYPEIKSNSACKLENNFRIHPYLERRCKIFRGRWYPKKEGARGQSSTVEFFLFESLAALDERVPLLTCCSREFNFVEIENVCKHFSSGRRSERVRLRQVITYCSRGVEISVRTTCVAQTASTIDLEACSALIYE